MNKVIKILMVDDHSITLEGYKSILSNHIGGDIQLLFDTAGSCEEAYSKIENKGTKPYDIIFLDINLPPAEYLDIYSGEDLGQWIKKKDPNYKIIVLTMLNENFRLYNIFKNLNPEGLLIKSDITPIEFYKAFENVANNKNYYSHSVTNLMRKHFANDFLLDGFDRSILYYLSKGIKTKDLTEEIPLSLATIEKRKKNMKEAFGVEENGDLILIDKAKQLGFL